MYRVRLKITKLGRCRFLSHLDMMRTMERAIRRAGLKPEFTQGFHPHPKISFAAPLAVGISSEAEIVDIELAESIGGEKLIQRLNRALPDDIRVISVEDVSFEKKSLMSRITASEYNIYISGKSVDRKVAGQKINEILSSEKIFLKKEKDGKIKERDVRPNILELKIREDSDIEDSRHDKIMDEGAGFQSILVTAKLATGSRANLRADDLLKILIEKGIVSDTDRARIHRTKVYVKQGENLLSPV